MSYHLFIIYCLTHLFCYCLLVMLFNKQNKLKYFPSLYIDVYFNEVLLNLQLNCTSFHTNYCQLVLDQLRFDYMKRIVKNVPTSFNSVKVIYVA